MLAAEEGEWVYSSADSGAVGDAVGGDVGFGEVEWEVSRVGEVDVFCDECAGECGGGCWVAW